MICGPRICADFNVDTLGGNARKTMIVPVTSTSPLPNEVLRAIDMQHIVLLKTDPGNGIFIPYLPMLDPCLGDSDFDVESVGTPVYVSGGSTLNVPVAATASGETGILFLYGVDELSNEFDSTVPGWTFDGKVLVANSGSTRVYSRVFDGSEGASVPVSFAVDSYVVGYTIGTKNIVGPAAVVATSSVVSGSTISAGPMNAVPAPQAVIGIAAAYTSGTINNSPSPNEVTRQQTTPTNFFSSLCSALVANDTNNGQTDPMSSTSSGRKTHIAVSYPILDCRVPPSFIAAGPADTTGASTVLGTFPTSPTIGDRAIMLIYGQPTSQYGPYLPAAPAGWTEVLRGPSHVSGGWNNLGYQSGFVAYTRVIDGSEGASASFSGNGSFTGQMLLFSECSIAATVADPVTTGTQEVKTPDVTTTTTSSLVVNVAATNGPKTQPTAPSPGSPIGGYVGSHAMQPVEQVSSAIETVTGSTVTFSASNSHDLAFTIELTI